MDPKAKPDARTENNSAARGNLTAAIDQLWIRFLPEIRKRVELLQLAAADHGHSANLREEAVAAAHKLAGALGTFDLEQGTDLAREYEQLAGQKAGLDKAASERLAAIATELGVIVNARK
jgi:HPt (histidine-containing phosphotransfer) domain-containing protein